jgi:ABC-type polysaccharide/polyol phosphate export permease
MLIPLIGFILGIPILAYAVFCYTGIAIFRKIPQPKKQKGNLPLAIGLGLISIALMLGIIGYFSPIKGDSVRYVRIIIGTVGLLLTGYQVGIIWLTSKSFKNLIKRLKQQIRLQKQQLRRYWELLHVLVSRNLKVRYRGSFLGIYWSLLSPLIMTGLYTAIFGTTFASYYGNSILNYMLAAFTGLVVINFFSASTSQALTSVVVNGFLLNKIRLPVSIFPVSMIAANIFQFAVGAFPLLAIMTFMNSKSIVNVFALLFPSLALVLLCTGVSFLVSALFVFFRDLPYFYELVVFVLWVSSPIFYPAAIVPTQVKQFLGLNPLSPIIESIRQIALSGALPNLSLIGSALLSGIIILSLGWTCFHSWRSNFMDLL